MKSPYLKPTLGVAAACSLLLTACGGGSGSGSSDDGGTVTIKVAIQTEEGTNKPYLTTIDNFQKEHPDIKVDVQQIPNDQLANVIKTQLQGGNAPDVWYGSPGSGNPNSLLPLAQAGYLLDLTDEDWAKSAVPESAHDLYYQDDKQWAIPLDLVPIPWLVNADATKAANIEVATTFDELVQACGTAQDAGHPLVQLAGAVPPNTGLLALELAASRVYAQQPDWNQQRADGDVTFADTQGWKDTLQAIVDMNKAGCFQEGAEGGTFDNLFSSVASGDSLSMVGPGSVLETIRSLAPSSASIAPYALPAESADDTFVFASPSNAFGANAQTEHPDQVKTFLQYWTEPATQDAFAKIQGNLSLQTVLAGAAVPSDYQNIAEYVNDPDKNAPLANLFWPNGQVYLNLGQGVQGLLTGQADVNQVLESMDSAWSSS